MSKKKSTAIVAGALAGVMLLSITASAAPELKVGLSKQEFFVKNEAVEIEAYNINGNNYVKLRDVGKLVDFGVEYNHDESSVTIDPYAPYTPEVKPGTPKDYNDIPYKTVSLAESDPSYYKELWAAEVYNYKMVRNYPTLYRAAEWDSYQVTCTNLTSYDPNALTDAQKAEIKQIKAARESLVQLIPFSDGINGEVLYIWGDDMPVTTKDVEKKFTVDSYDNADYAPFLIPYLVEDQSAAKGTLIITSGGGNNYRSMSGVARSLNYYPIGDEKAEEGIVNLALGLGKYIVDGGMTLRFSPYHPSKVLQTSEMEIALKETQTRFYALDLRNAGHNFSIDDGFNLLKLHVKEAEKDGALNYIASTYDPYDQIIRDGLYPGGRKVITFANILQHDVFPLPRILQLALKHGEQEMRRPVEIEFAATMSREKDKTGTFYLLQIRPIVDTKEMLDEDLTAIPDNRVLLRSNNSLGHGIMNEIHDIIYVKTDDYSASHNQEIAWEIEKLNQQFLDESRNYVLVGPGRWGSSDTWLGIPVKWPHISAARVIVEAGLTNYRVDPSQGTHFFQNLTSFGVGYFTINAFMNDGIYNQEFLNAQPAVHETKYLRHVHFCQPMVVKMDGKKKLGVVLMPEE